MKKVLITGADGYIGSVLVGMALEKRFDVHALDRFFFGEDALGKHADNPRLHLHKKDIRDIGAEDLKGFDAIFDLAVLSNDPSADLNPELTDIINHQARAALAQNAKKAGVKRYVFASTSAVYGASQKDNLTEADETNPISTYAKTILKAERAIMALADAGFTPCAFRNAMVFGLSPRMRFDLVVNLMTFNAANDDKICIIGDGQQWRPLIHVRDVYAAMLRALDTPKDAVGGEVFNLGHSNLRVLNIAYIVREALPFSLQIDIVPDDPDKRPYAVSFEKLERALKFTPQHDVSHGVHEVYQALKSGHLTRTPKTSTVGWYKTILEADQLVKQVSLNGRLLF